jgi:hypothetical protein
LLRPEPKPSAIEIIREIIKIHEELAKKEGKELINKVILDATSEEPSVDPITVSVTLGQRKEVGEWIKELSSLYVKERDKVPQLHVRLFIIGLCLTDLNTSIKLHANKFFEKIRDDVKETIYPNLLTEKRPQTLAQFI